MSKFNSSTSSECGLAEPIAIVGMACQLPGNVDSSASFWKMLMDKQSGQGPVPAQRWNINAFYSPKQGRPGSMTTTGGYFLQRDITSFDPSFFGIHNREALYMDPEQRLLLETVFQCFEDAGVTLDQADGANIGCYVGKFTYDFLNIQCRDSEFFDRFSATGMGTTILANRISHAFNLKGPSFVLDTACSSSMYCVHLACSALRQNECESALVAGVNLIQSPEQHLATIKAGILSPDSTSHTFDQSANGYGRGEGVSVLYLKRLSAALRDGDSIRSIIRGTAVNSNGKTQGITLPSLVGQEEVIRKAYVQAGLPVTETDYVEAHGTGTSVGDPIEVECLAKVFCFDGDRRQSPLLISANKPNFGHSEAASAITSIIKATLALENSIIPATIGIKNLNSSIKESKWNVQIVRDHTDWPGGLHRPRRASVNSFGFGGANAHMVLEAAPQRLQKSASDAIALLLLKNSRFLLPISAPDEWSLEQGARRLCSLEASDIAITDLAYTFSERRTKFPYRGFALVDQKSLKNGLSLDSFVFGTKASSSIPRSRCFIYTGQGAQWPQMGLELVQRYKTVRRSLEALDSALSKLPNPPSWTILDILEETSLSSRINRSEFAQPVCTAVQIAVTDLLREWNVTPTHAIGHSSGEIAAAYVAGKLTAEEAIAIAYYRGLVSAKVTSDGAMLAVSLSFDDASKEIRSLGLTQAVGIACINSPNNVTISGDCEAIFRLSEHLADAKVFCRKLKTDGKAYHSHHMREVGQLYEDFLCTIPQQSFEQHDKPSQTVWISSVKLDVISGPIDRSYWRKNLEEPVRFSQAIFSALKKNDLFFIEIGPHSSLQLPIEECLSNSVQSRSSDCYISVMKRGISPVESVLTTMGKLWMEDHSVNFQRINSTKALQYTQGTHVYKPKHVTHLPSYKWKYDTVLWKEAGSSKEYRFRKFPRHDLLGSRTTNVKDRVAVWTNKLRISDIPWLNDHRIDRAIVVPAAAYIAMVIEAAVQIAEVELNELNSCELTDIVIHKALVLTEEMDDEVEIATAFSAVDASSRPSTQWKFSISSGKGDKTIQHTEGLIFIGRPKSKLQASIISQITKSESYDEKSWYEQISRSGLNFGPSFRMMSDIECGEPPYASYTEASVKLYNPDDTAHESRYLIHPAAIDGILQPCLVSTAKGFLDEYTIRIPVYIKSFSISLPLSWSSAGSLKVRAVSESLGRNTSSASTDIYLDDGKTLVVQVKNCHLQIPYEEREYAKQERQPILRTVWKPDITIQSDDHAVQALKCYSHSFTSGSNPRGCGLKEMRNALDLFVHKRPNIKILAIGKVSWEKSLLPILQIHSSFRLCDSFVRLDSEASDSLVGEILDFTSSEFKTQYPLRAKEFDLILCDQVSQHVGITRLVKMAQNYLADHGNILALVSDDLVPDIQSNLETTIVANNNLSSLILANKKNNKVINALQTSRPPNLIVVEPSTPSKFVEVLCNHLGGSFLGSSVKRLSLNQIPTKSGLSASIIIVCLELEQPFLTTMTENEMKLLKSMLNHASKLLWITGGNLLTGPKPEFAVAAGLARSVMLEYPALKFFTLDLDDINVETSQHFYYLTTILHQLSQGTLGDYEFALEKGVLHVSRIVPDYESSKDFRERNGLELSRSKLDPESTYRLRVRQSQQLKAIYFQQTESIARTLKPHEIEVDIKAINIDRDTAEFMIGDELASSQKAAVGFSGRVLAVGSQVTGIKQGARVAVVAPGSLSTRNVFPAWSCVELNSGYDDYSSGAAITIIYATVLYALDYCTRLSKSNSVVVFDAASDLGTVAILLCLHRGAKVDCIVKSENEARDLRTRIQSPRISIHVVTEDASMETIQSCQHSQGADIVFSPFTVWSPQQLLAVTSDGGSIVEIGHRNKNESIELWQSASERAISVSRSTIRGILSLKGPKIEKMWHDILEDGLAIHNLIGQPYLVHSIQEFGLENIEEALTSARSLSKGPIVLNIEPSNQQFDIKPVKYRTRIDPEKTYLMIGCLGGLGRSVSEWMWHRGARRFVYLNRTGDSKSITKRFIQAMVKKGADVKVIKGDVTKYEDVQRAVHSINSPLGGIVQGAMTLGEALFDYMSHSQWHAAMRPKTLGTLNIHRATYTQSSRLDFFLLMSSISGTVGVATESNYCAANTFLDAFARYRHSIGLPAVSVGIGMVSQIGYLHEHSDIQSGLERKGLTPLTASEFLNLIDLTLSKERQRAWVPQYDQLSKANLLTGLEPVGLQRLRELGFEGILATFDDPRAVLLSASLHRENTTGTETLSSALPGGVAKALDHGDGVEVAVLKSITKQFSNFLLIEEAKMDIDKPLASYGIDSVLAAGVRTWLYKKFNINLPFMMLLGQKICLRDLAGELVRRLESLRSD